MKCYCGGKTKQHLIGDPGCYREKVICRPRRISCEKDRWFVDGHNITGTTLRQQRMYHQHPCGNCSRPIGGVSENSISA